jgi:hypothetical protein
MFILRQWAINGWLWVDQGLNWLTGGAPDETLSSRMGRLKDDPKAGLLGWISRRICWLLDKLDPGHCDNTEQYEQDIVHRPESLDDKPGD